MLTFENYFALLLLLILPLYFVLYFTKVITHLSLPINFSNWQGKNYEWKSKRVLVFHNLKIFLCILGLIFLIIALANPKISRFERRYISRGSEVMFVLDTSPSMAANDMNGKRRIDEAKNAIEKVVLSLPGTSFGLIEIGSDASCVMPPSLDSKTFLKKLKQTKLGFLGDGTALGLGISNAIFHLSSSNSPQKIIVLITDGENNAGTIHPFTAAKLAKEENIPIYVLGIGTRGTVSIEYTDPNTGKTYSGFLESSYNSESLDKIASISGGKSYEIINLSEMTNLVSSIIQNEVVLPHFYTVSVDTEYYKIFLILASVCLMTAWIISQLYLKEVL